MSKTIIFKIKGMHCSSCAMNIDGALEDSEGVTEANTHYAKQLTEVKFDDEKISPERILEIIRQSGYEAESA